MKLAFYNQTVIKYCALAAYDPSIFSFVKSSWFDLTPESTFVFTFVETIIRKYGVFDDTTYLKSREYHHSECIDHAKTVHSQPKLEILHNDIYQKLDIELSDVLRDVAQGKADALTTSYTRRVTDLRDTILSVYNQEQFMFSLSKAQSIIKQGGRVEQAYLQIKIPEPPMEVTTSFVEQTKLILSKKVGEPLMTTIDAIDGNGGVERGNIITIGGDTGVMKTRFATWMILEMLKENSSYKCLYFQREMTKRQQFYLLCQWAFEKSYKDIRQWSDEFLDAKVAELPQEMLDILDRFIILDSEDFTNAEDVYHEVQRHKPDIWCVDFLTMMVGGNDSSDTNMAVYALTDKLKETAKRTDSVGILISQIKKGSVETRVCKMPRPDDLEWSGRLKHISSNIFMVFYPNYYDFNVDNRYYVIEEGKSRFSGRAHIYLEAMPWAGKFARPTAGMEDEIRSWYQDYRKKRR